LAIKLLAGFLLSLGSLCGLLYFLLQNALEARFAKKLEETKHDLQLDLEKMSKPDAVRRIFNSQRIWLLAPAAIRF
jgi:hypothetical protein